MLCKIGHFEDAFEKKLKVCGGTSDIRALGNEDDNIKKSWKASARPLQQIISDRFKRLILKEKKVQSREPISDDKIEDMLNLLCTLFPNIDPKKLQKKHTQQLRTLQECHTRQRQYSFQIKKCSNRDCCLPPCDMTDSQLQWLPCPLLYDTGEHYQPFSAVDGADTTENDRPTLKTKAVPVSIKKQEATKKTRQTKM